MFHQPPWIFENAPFHWYRSLRRWFFWQQAKRMREIEDSGGELPGGWDAERFTGGYT